MRESRSSYKVGEDDPGIARTMLVVAAAFAGILALLMFFPGSGS